MSYLVVISKHKKKNTGIDDLNFRIIKTMYKFLYDYELGLIYMIKS